MVCNLQEAKWKSWMFFGGAIKEVGFVKRSKTYGRTFAPTLTREEYFATTIFSHRYKPEIVDLFAALLKREDITHMQLEAIEKLVANRKALI